MELSVGDVNGQLLKNVLLLGIEVESHLAEPLERFVRADFFADQTASYGSPVNVLVDLEKMSSHKTSKQTEIMGLY